MKVDRRTLLTASAAAGICAALPTSALARGRLPRLYVFDGRFAASAKAAGLLSQQGVAILDPRDHDLGIAWHDTIPALLEREKGAIAGMTLWSDRFICQSFARDLGIRDVRVQMVEPTTRDTQGLQEWMLS